MHDSGRASTGRLVRWMVACVAVLATGLLLGPLWGLGVTVLYDMPWSPVPRLTPFALGIGTPAPRAVPGDAVLTFVGLLIGAAAAQKLILSALLIAAGLGAARLIATLRPDAGGIARAATVIGAIWNPFVLDRLAVGQWVVLLGYAVTPWALARAASARAGVGGAALGWCLLVGLASLGGANPWLMVTLVVALSLLVTQARLTTCLAVAATALGTAAVWALPAVLGQVAGGAGGADAFAPRADTPFGVVVSVLSGGGFWNEAAHLDSRDQMAFVGPLVLLTLVALTVGLVHLWRHQPNQRRLLPVILVPLGLVLVSATPVLRPLWEVVVGLPGGGILRDSQKLLAPWVVLGSVGLGLVVTALLARSRRHQILGPVAVALTLAPMALQPSAFWGLEGQLRATAVPAEFAEVASLLSARPAGLVGVLPWTQYRRYDWNGGRVSLTLIPRMVDQVTLFDDSLPLRDRTVPGEDPRARRVSQAIASGQPPVSALREEGAAYVVVEKASGLGPTPEAGGAEVLHDGPNLLVLRVASGDTPEMGGTLWAGWLITLVTWGVLVLGRLRHAGTFLRPRLSELLRSRA